jgi:hypothetical protein
MYNLKYIICLTITSILTIGVANAQGKQPNQPNSPTVNQDAASQAHNQELNNLLTQPTTQVEQTAPISRNGKALNTPAATGGSDYDSQIVSGLDDYKKRKRMVAERVAEMQRIREEEFRRKAYEQALKAAQEREKGRMAAAGKKMTNQDYFDKQTKILQNQK